MSVSCPKSDCGYEGSEHGVKVHWGKSDDHDGTLARTYDCEVCGETTKVKCGRDNPHTCSKLCHDVLMSSHGTLESFIEDRFRTCRNCGAEFRTNQDSFLCSRGCADEWRKKTGVIRGENHPNWREGESPGYGFEWAAKAEEIRERDDYECQDCGLEQEDAKRALSVHHIVPLRDFDDRQESHDPENLITLCRRCHMKRERKLDQATGV